jgi:L-alanine-DL-glutamate epimerase-like enolase superfamily enzyme
MSTVASISTRIVEVDLAKPVGTAIHAMSSVGCVLVQVRTSDGVVGQGYVFALNGDRVKSLDEQIVGLAEQVRGRSIFETEGIWHDLWGRINAMGHKGVTISAMSAIDVALWDAVGRTLGQPLHRLWGSCRDDVATYATSGLWLSQSIDELVAQAAAFVEQGFVSMKIRLGSIKPASDVARVAAVRDAIGPDIELLSDVNQGLTPKAAIKLGRMLEPYDLGWIEEPVSAYDLDGHAQVRSALDTPIASGETEYTRHGMQAMLRAGACDVLMPDLQRIGGYSEFRKADAVASAWNIPTSSHFFTEHSLCLAGSLANLISVEHCDWFAPLFNEDMELRNGRLVVPDRPGTGFTFAR